MAVAEQIEPLLNEMVLVGGCALGLLMTDPAAPSPSVTLDVDFTINVATYIDYHDITKRMGALGFQPLISNSAPICRFTKNNLEVDIMPADGNILGFTNKWYQHAIATCHVTRLPNDIVLRHIAGPAFLATKLSAFLGRGKGDYFSSRDFEDIVAVVDGRPELLDEVRNEISEISNYISSEFNRMLKMRSFLDSLPGMLPGEAEPGKRLEILLERFRGLARIGHSRL